MTAELRLDPGVSRRISRGIVAVLKARVGRGPTLTRTFINDNVVTVILHDTLTPVERTLTGAEHADIVADMRRSFQAAICEEMVSLVERETSCNVKAFMSDHSVLPDYAVECFVLEAPGADPAEAPTPCADQREQDHEAEPGSLVQPASA